MEKKIDQINWNQLFYFHKIAFCGSVREAAIILNLSPSTLSEHLTSLEKGLEIRLFARTCRKLILTPEGSRLFHVTKKMFESGQRALDSVSPLPLGGYPISIAISPSASFWAFEQFIGRYIVRFGSSSFNIRYCSHEEMERELIDSHIDFAFSDTNSSSIDVEQATISRSFLRFFVAEKLKSTPVETLLRRYPVLTCDADGIVRDRVEDLIATFDVSLKGRVTSQCPSVVYSLCEAGVGIGVLNEESVLGLKLRVAPIDVPEKSFHVDDKLLVLWSKSAEESEVIQSLKLLLADNNRTTEHTISDDRRMVGVY